MATINKTLVNKDLANKRITVEREFDAPVEQVWKAWTESEQLDQWWAPKPWKAKTKTMDFRSGGCWLYSMVGPDNSEQFCRVDYNSIDINKGFQAKDSFCDANGEISTDFPNMIWKNTFSKTESGTKVIVEISFSSEADIRTIIEMGFEAGFTAALGNLDELLEK